MNNLRYLKNYLQAEPRDGAAYVTPLSNLLVKIQTATPHDIQLDIYTKNKQGCHRVRTLKQLLSS